MPGQPQATTILISARRLIVDADTPPMKDAAVLVDGTRIREVGRRSEVEARAPSGCRRIDAGSWTLLPGLVDAHIHITTEGGGSQDPEGSRRRGIEQGTSNLMNALKWGVTTVRDAGSWEDALGTLMERIRRSELVAPRIRPTGVPVTIPLGHGHWFGGAVQGESGMADVVRRKAQAGMTHIKVMATGGSSTPTSDPRRPQFTEAELRVLAREAERSGLRTMAHATATEGIRQCLAAGIGSIEHCRTLSPSGEWEYPQSLFEEIAASECWVDPTPAHQYRAIMTPPPDADPIRVDQMRAERAKRIEVYRRLLAAGHRRWLVGTDTGWSSPQDTYPIVCRVMVDDIGMSPRDVLRAATSDAARALGLEGEIGAVREGFAADLIAVEGDPLSDVNDLARIRVVMVGGVQVDASVLAATPRPLT